MADTTFTDGVTTIDSSWLNPVNDLLYTVFDGAGDKTTAADAISAVTSAVNTIAGDGEVLKDASTSTLELRPLTGGTNTTITTNTDDITIDVDSVTSYSSDGTGEGTLIKARVGDDLPFKSLKAGNQVVITEDADEITITASSSVGASANLVTYTPTAPYTENNAQDMLDKLSTTPTVTTPIAGDNSNAVATTAFVQGEKVAPVATRYSTTGGVWSPPNGVLYMVVEAWGAGGGGGSSGVLANQGGAGGGGGGYVKAIVDATSVISITVVPGVLGAGGLGAHPTGNGSDGTDTIVNINGLGTTLTAEGGEGGNAGDGAGAGNDTSTGGAGGASFGYETNQLAVDGGDGGNGGRDYVVGGTGGYGGGSFGFPGAGQRFGQKIGAAHRDYAGGGGGAVSYSTTALVGGNGGRGLVIITAYFQ